LPVGATDLTLCFEEDFMGETRMAGVAEGRTLIVDDEEDMRVLLRATIDQANRGLLVACEAADGLEAVERWRECRPDIIVLDQRMPRLSGLEAAEQILKEKPDQRIVLFSAFLTEALRVQAEKLGVRSCLGKDDLAKLPETLWALAAA
jgi:two-component system chemotaxis response regulator CheY